MKRREHLRRAGAPTPRTSKASPPPRPWGRAKATSAKPPPAPPAAKASPPASSLRALADRLSLHVIARRCMVRIALVIGWIRDTAAPDYARRRMLFAEWAIPLRGAWSPSFQA